MLEKMVQYLINYSVKWGERSKRKCHTYVKRYMNIVKMRTEMEMLACDYEQISKRTKKI